MNIRIALAQLDVRVGDIDHNLKLHLDYAEKAKAREARLVVFPELSITGYTLRDLVHEVTQHAYLAHPSLHALLELSKDIQIIAGGVEQTNDFRFHNAAFLFAEGTMYTVHRKIYLPTYGMFEENRYFLPGRSVGTFDSVAGRIGVLVCEDLWHMALPYLLAQDGARIIVGMAASPTRLGGDSAGQPAVADVNLEHHRTYARLLSSYVVFCNRVGFEDGVGFWGGSTIIAPDGSVINKAPFFDESLLFADISPDAIRRARSASRHALDEQPEFTIRELERIVQREHHIDILAKI
jgi:predicted amidohydrolase